MNELAILIPCYNEELTIAKVITDFRQQFPDAEIYVYDNNSSDQTAAIAKKKWCYSQVRATAGQS